MSVRRLHAAAGPVRAVVDVPGSKSIANRALVVAALADGASTITGLPDGDDTAAMLRCLDGLGLGVGVDGSGSTVVVTGSATPLHPVTDRVHAALAGTTSRFVTALAALADHSIVVDGDPPLRGRPMAELHEALGALGACIEYEETAGRLPVRIAGPLHRGGTVALPGDVSSQFVTALLMIGPVLDGGLTIELTSPLVSRPYVELTASVMAAFGVEAVEIAERTIVVPQADYRATDFAVEPDASSASYPLAVAAVAAGEVTTPGLTRASLQGDLAIVDVLASMGCVVVERDDGWLGIRRDPSASLTGVDIDMSDVSDLVPTVAAVAAAASTPTTIRGVGFIRGKESDRLGDLADELTRCGADVTVTDDGLHIEPVAELHGARLETHHDHRLAMAFAVLGAAVDGIGVVDPDVVTKSWPGFWDAYDRLLASADVASEEA